MVEVPLLAEGGRSAHYDGVVVVTAPMEVRLDRLVASGRYTREEAASRIASQAVDTRREEIANWIVKNGGPLEETREQVRKIVNALAGTEWTSTPGV